IMFGLPLRISPPRNSPEKTDKTASFDSELMLVKKKTYNLNMWLPNPYYLGFKNQKTSLFRSDVIMTSRLDGADTATVKRIINDSMEAEKNGLKGKAYFDARWIEPGKIEVSGYAFYDKSLHETARILSESKIIPVILNDGPELFQKGESPDTALYCGWYSLAQYVDAFTWQKGSVGYHIASAECTTLKKEDSQVWCKKMLDNGIAATIGPVGEPYVQAFPVPALFFSFLAEGYLTLAESYLVSLPYLSWKMVLVGDPLYRLNLKP
ncbi:MAG: TIGR03790 family protein, partial [Proteobacteria bacterium]|nr:TIGR03790 family protein [Pseudomonadota bacterium]